MTFQGKVWMGFLLVFCGTTTRSERLAASGGRALTQVPCVARKGLCVDTLKFFVRARLQACRKSCHFNAFHIDSEGRPRKGSHLT